MRSNNEQPVEREREEREDELDPIFARDLERLPLEKRIRFLGELIEAMEGGR